MLVLFRFPEREIVHLWFLYRSPMNFSSVLNLEISLILISFLTSTIMTIISIIRSRSPLLSNTLIILRSWLPVHNERERKINQINRLIFLIIWLPWILIRIRLNPLKKRIGKMKFWKLNYFLYRRIRRFRDILIFSKKLLKN
jgi:hypothetical protein